MQLLQQQTVALTWFARFPTDALLVIQNPKVPYGIQPPRFPSHLWSASQFCLVLHDLEHSELLSFRSLCPLRCVDRERMEGEIQGDGPCTTQ